MVGAGRRARALVAGRDARRRACRAARSRSKALLLFLSRTGPGKTRATITFGRRHFAVAASGSRPGTVKPAGLRNGLDGSTPVSTTPIFIPWPLSPVGRLQLGRLDHRRPAVHRRVVGEARVDLRRRARRRAASAATWPAGAPRSRRAGSSSAPGCWACGIAARTCAAAAACAPRELREVGLASSRCARSAAAPWSPRRALRSLRSRPRAAAAESRTITRVTPVLDAPPGCDVPGADARQRGLARVAADRGERGGRRGRRHQADDCRQQQRGDARFRTVSEAG